MSKQPTERAADADARRREVGNQDLEIANKAISDTEVLMKDLYVLRRVLGEVGNLDHLYGGLKQIVAMVQEEGRRINAELEAAKTRLATVQQEEVEKRKVVAELSREIEEKTRELSAYSTAIDKIMGKAAA